MPDIEELQKKERQKEEEAPQFEEIAKKGKPEQKLWAIRYLLRMAEKAMRHGNTVGAEYLIMLAGMWAYRFGLKAAEVLKDQRSGYGSACGAGFRASETAFQMASSRAL